MSYFFTFLFTFLLVSYLFDSTYKRFWKRHNDSIVDLYSKHNDLVDRLISVEDDLLVHATNFHSIVKEFKDSVTTKRNEVSTLSDQVTKISQRMISFEESFDILVEGLNKALAEKANKAKVVPKKRKKK